MLPRVSVIMPHYNKAEYVEEAIRSIFEQDYKGDINLVIVDDASTDNSVERIKNMLGNYDEDGSVISTKINNINVFLILHKENVKQAAARNTAISFIWDSSDCFVLCDSDDVQYSGKISACVNSWLKNHNAIGVVYHDYDILHTSTGRITREYKEPFSRERLFQECIIFSSSLISKKAMEFAGNFDEELSPIEDYDIWLRITARFLAVHIPESLTLYKVTGGNSSTTTDKTRMGQLYQQMFSKWAK